jgi:hypothetical protein
MVGKAGLPPLILVRIHAPKKSGGEPAFLTLRLWRLNSKEIS